MTFYTYKAQIQEAQLEKPVIDALYKAPIKEKIVERTNVHIPQLSWCNLQEKEAVWSDIFLHVTCHAPLMKPHDVLHDYLNSVAEICPKKKKKLVNTSMHSFVILYNPYETKIASSQVP